jgi:DNA-binding winged helix-turn-helix (wHTH) protein
MTAAPAVFFPPFRLDVLNEQLWDGSRHIPLRPKLFAVLRYLVEHPGHLITKEEFTVAIWADTRVSENLLKSYIRDLRAVLGDTPEAPRFIETIPRRGYRWIAPLVTTPPVSSVRLQVPSSPSPQVSDLKSQASTIVGRETEITQLQAWFEKAKSGDRQLVFITGEPGIGKTSVVEAFLARLTDEHEHEFWVGRGQRKVKGKSGKSKVPNPQPPRRSRSVFLVGDKGCPSAAGEIMGTARHNKFGSSVATARQKATSPADAGRDLRLVHRRV